MATSASPSRSLVDAVPVEVLCSILEWEGDWKWTTRAALTCKAFRRAVVSVVENQVSEKKEVSEEGVWCLSNHQRQWHRRVFANLRHMCHGVLETIKVVDCSRWKQEKDEDIKQIAEAFSALELASGRTGPRSINLASGMHLTDAAVVEIAKVSSLESLNLSWCSKVTPKPFQAFHNHPNLRTLILQSCGKIQSVSDLTSIHQLEVLDLSGCMALEPKGLQGLSSLPHLRHLNLTYCNRLTDEDVEEVAQISSLRVLNLSYCWNLTDKAARALSAATWLEELDLRQYNQMTPGGVQVIRDQIPGLRVFHPPVWVNPPRLDRMGDNPESDDEDEDGPKQIEAKQSEARDTAECHDQMGNNLDSDGGEGKGKQSGTKFDLGDANNIARFSSSPSPILSQT